jgi:hypothetical protein
MYSVRPITTTGLVLVALSLAKISASAPLNIGFVLPYALPDPTVRLNVMANDAAAEVS